MNRSTTHLKNKLPREAGIRKRLKGGEPELLVPYNCSEILISFDGNMEMKKIGSPRVYRMLENHIYLLTPRARGAYLESQKDRSYLLLPQQFLSIDDDKGKLQSVGIGIYKLEEGVFGLNELLDLILSDDLLQLNATLAHYFGVHSSSETVIDAIDMIKSAKGRLSVKEIYESLEISKSKLEKCFNREVGLTPKEFCRIEKLNRFIEVYRGFPELSLTELTYLGGYYDQSHLIKEFNYFLGMSPGKFFSLRNAA